VSQKSVICGAWCKIVPDLWLFNIFWKFVILFGTPMQWPKKIPEPFFSLKIIISEKRKCANKWFSIYFCFSELLILREKRFAVFFGLFEYQKSYKFSKNIEKNTKQESCKKKLQFCTGFIFILVNFAMKVTNTFRHKCNKPSTWKTRA